VSWELASIILRVVAALILTGVLWYYGTPLILAIVIGILLGWMSFSRNHYYD
jgi:hypothetical protein